MQKGVKKYDLLNFKSSLKKLFGKIERGDFL